MNSRQARPDDMTMLTLKGLTALADKPPFRYDVAESHLACAVGLPGAENLDIPACLRKLDRWAFEVRRSTERLMPQFERQPERFRGSWAYFRLMAMATILQRDLRVRATDKLNADNSDFSDSRDLFLHGVLEGRPGTCSSLPVLYAAIGQRLSYPLKLIRRPEHCFARWEGADGERFNIECTTVGFFSPPDRYYENWPRPIDPRGLVIFVPGASWYCRRSETYFLRALTPREVLSGDLVQRAYCLLHNGRHREAVESSCWGHELAPRHRPHEGTLWRLLVHWRKYLDEQLPPPRPTVTIGPSPRRFGTIPTEAEHQIRYLEVVDDFMQRPGVREAYRPPIRRSPKSGVPVGLPESIHVSISQRRPDSTHEPNPMRKP